MGDDETNLGLYLGPQTSTIMRLMDLAEVAGEEAEGRDVPAGLWSCLEPTDPFLTCIPDVYRSHVRELLDRPKHDFDLGTLAEVMLALSIASNMDPLPSHNVELFHWCFRQVMGDERADRLEVQTQAPDDEFVRRARVKLRGGFGGNRPSVKP